ncbi:triose-phosphate isomerase [Micromonospora olivasterospora]|uniref:Triosephosphate isomerase n=1 Tax=Micromonospora olivasterospora TaxID=1880 RepID=A0A562IJP1_MICOL|nr:triose-phosphate isomerase [Micromonospora olivasterospora]TWH71241.1 triosephosphate isomerase [Micromonospora olivasterospora]
MTGSLTPPFFEIGPKNLLRRREIESVAVAAGRAGDDHGVTVLLTVPTALVAPVEGLGCGVRVLGQGMHTDRLGPSMNRVTAESLADAGAWGVMLNHDADPLDGTQLELALRRAAEVGLETVVCAATQHEAVRFAALEPTVVLYEPPSLIGTSGAGRRDWIAASTEAIHRAGHTVLAMHAGGISTPATARAVMAAGADGTGSTSGVLSAPDREAAARQFIAATRIGWDEARRARPATTT